MKRPQTRYAKTVDDVHIGYQVLGEGPMDVMLVPFGFSNIEVGWEVPSFATSLQALASLGRVLLFDRRGTGTSDRASLESGQSIETRMDDIRAVMDAVGSERAVLFGAGSGGAPLCVAFAATYPERVIALVVFNAAARGTPAADYPFAQSDEAFEAWITRMEAEWGAPEYIRYFAEQLTPSLKDDPRYVEAVGHWMRLSVSPGEAVTVERTIRDTDVRDILPTIQVPTLVMHRRDDRATSIEEGRYLAERIPGAQFVELAGADHSYPFDDAVPHIARFLTSVSAEQADFDRMLATVLFTDIVDSTARSAALGDRAWRDLLSRHHAAVRALLSRYRGIEIDTAGDGFLASFDGPARAIRCALAMVDAVQRLGIEIRAGIHTGELTTVDGALRGIAVHIGARVAASAGPSEVVVSQTVKDLTAGSGLSFDYRGEHELKGVPDLWRLYTARL